MKKTKWLWLAATLLWTAFIFYNSAQNAATSTQISDSFMELFGLSIPVFWVRKSAHFAAFGLLGVLISGTLSAFGKRGHTTVWLLVLLAACADETVQLFPAGRSSELRDVWIDFCGGVAGNALFCTAKRIFCKKRK